MKIRGNNGKDRGSKVEEKRGQEERRKAKEQESMIMKVKQWQRPLSFTLNGTEERNHLPFIIHILNYH